MKKIILSLILIILLSFTVSATTNKHLFVTDDHSPVSDVQILIDLREAFDSTIGTGNYETKLNSDITKSDLDYRVTVFIYQGKALIILGEHSPVEHVNLTLSMTNYLTDKNIDVTKKTSNEISNDDLTKELDVIVPIPLEIEKIQLETISPVFIKTTIINPTSEDFLSPFEYSTYINNKLYSICKDDCELNYNLPVKNGLKAGQSGWSGFSMNADDGEYLKAGTNAIKIKLSANGQFIEKSLQFDISGDEDYSCFDSDSGKNYYEKGYVTLNEERWDDTCYVSENYKAISDKGEGVHEQYCDEGGNPIVASHKCENGCENGKCLKDVSSTEMDLKNFPDFFNENLKVIIGDRAPAKDTQSAINVIEAVFDTLETGSNGIKQIPIGTTELSSNIADPYKINSVSIGSPCKNSVSAQFMGNPFHCDLGLYNIGRIKLSSKNNKIQMLVAGSDEDWTYKASEVLKNKNKYNLEGADVCIYEELGSLKVKDCEYVDSCKDSDGDDIFTTGEVIGLKNNNFNYKDSCLSDTKLQEYICIGDNYETKEIECSYRCDNGRCLTFYSDDEEIDVSEEEIESSIDCPKKECSIKSEKCSNKDKIIIEECKVYIEKNGECEPSVITNSKIVKNACIEEGITDTDCQGCQIDKNTCIPFGTRLEKDNIGYYCDISKKTIEQKENKASCQNSHECQTNNCKSGQCTPICEGCLNENNVCIPFGTRTETQYCDLDYSFKSQKSEDMSCSNNYECSSNVCVNNQCISPSFIQKIIDWFKKLFGG